MIPRKNNVRDKVKLFASGKFLAQIKLQLHLLWRRPCKYCKRYDDSVGCMERRNVIQIHVLLGCNNRSQTSKSISDDEKKWRVLNYVITLRNGLHTLAAAAGLDS
ncbi:MAG: hypothetical protein CM1200mP1_04310 [Candidatus Neomarinimicrobiota bacterium]|nr:MAG: hypothetical protein CM1200mP1_04310 [Candidatus Neomarinimicrobiota bacterium]